MITAKEFEQLDRRARLVVLRELQHHVGIDSDEYRKLARTHEWVLYKANNVVLQRPVI